MTTFLLFLLVLGALVLVHELGHFLMARRSGMKAEEFGFGFPPRLCGIVWNDDRQRYDIVLGNKEVSSLHTVYSINWIPFGGFVRIKGENGDGAKDSDSFASKSPFARIKVLSAGVVMNFLFAWVLISVVLMLGFPRSIDSDEKVNPDTVEVQIASVLDGTPAADMGLHMGDVVISVNGEKYLRVEHVQRLIKENAGKEISIGVKRGDETLLLHGTPRVDFPENQGSLGVSLGETIFAKYPFFQAILQGAVETYHLTIAMIFGIAKLLGSLVMGSREELSAVSGPLGIAYLTGEISHLGLAYLLYFTAILSVNLGILNILPFPALDGGRVLFVLIESLKGSPVSEKVEAIFHQVGFLLLLVLMVLITVHDISKFDVIGKIQSLF